MVAVLNPGVFVMLAQRLDPKSSLSVPVNQERSVGGTAQASGPEGPHLPSQAAHILLLAVLSWFPDPLRWYWGPC